MGCRDRARRTAARTLPKRYSGHDSGADSVGFCAMKDFARLAVVMLLSACASAHAQVQQKTASYSTMAPVGKYLMASAIQEIALARTAAPPSVSAHAEVLVLRKRGYEVAVKGDNGWVCFVERSWTSGLDDPEFWNPNERGPSCFNPPAVRSVLPQYLARTRWVVAGDTCEQIAKKARAAYATHRFTDPAPGSFSFMLSKEGYLNDQVRGPWYPHVMPFVAHEQVTTWAAGFDGSPILAGPYLRSYEPAVIFIPVRRWSDGSPGPPITALHSHG